MMTFQQQKQQILRLFEEEITIAKNQKDTNLENHLKEAQKHLAEEKIYVVVRNYGYLRRYRPRTD